MPLIVENPLADIEANMGMVIEGISTTRAAYELAQELESICPLHKPFTSYLPRNQYQRCHL